jgi:DNA-directed RNA polymerase subunit RPC12/RpoP
MNQEVKLIIKYLKANGGSIAHAARELDIKLTKTLRAALKDIDSNLERYRYAFKRHGDWFTLPSDKALTRDAQKVNSVCLRCNQIYSVSLISLESGRSIACHSCRMKERENIQVICKEDGSTFSSIRDFANSIGQLGQYQSIRHKLQAGHCFAANGKNYSLK